MATEAQQPVAVDSAINNDNSPVPQAVNGGPSESTPTNGAKLEQGAEPANKPGKTKEKEPPKDPHADPVSFLNSFVFHLLHFAFIRSAGLDNKQKRPFIRLVFNFSGIGCNKI